MKSERLSPVHRKELNTFLKILNTFCGHCERSQLNREDIRRNRGPLTKLREVLYGRPDRYSMLSRLCGECFDCVDSGLLTLVQTSRVLVCYRSSVEKIQYHCIREECELALLEAKRLRENILKDYFSD